MIFKRVISCLVLGCAAIVASAVIAQDDPDRGKTFYNNKTLRIVTGYPPGSTFDRYARSLGRHMGNHIAGKPGIIVQNMPGGGGLNAVAYVANVAPKDGLTLALSNPQMATAPLLEPKSAAFDPRQFAWIGAISDDFTVCAFWSADLKTPADLKRREIIVGATGAAGGSAIDGRMLNALFGYRFKIVTGYPGMIEVRLAAERGELDGQCGLPASTIKVDLQEAVKSGKVYLGLQLGLRSAPDYPAVPNPAAQTDSDDIKNIVRLAYAPLAFMRPVLAPGGVAPERIAELRRAFMTTMADAEFLREMETQKLDVRPVSPQTIAALVAELYATPPEVVARTRQMLGLEGR